MTSLYALAAEYREAAERLSDLDMDEQTIADTLEGMVGSVEDKVINTAKVIQSMDAEAAAIIAATKPMLDRAVSISKRSESLSKYLLNNMQIANLPKVKSEWFVVSLKETQRTIIDDESIIPLDYLREIPAVPARTEPDKNLIKKASKDGFTVAGAHIETHVTVNIK